LILLRRLREQPATPAVIALAEDGNELTAVRSLQLGAVDYLPKKLLTPERLSTAVRVALRRVERRVARRLASLANLSRNQAVNADRSVTASSPPSAEVGVGAGGPEALADGDAAATPAGETPAAPDTLQPEGVAALLAAANAAEVIPGYTLRLKIGESEK